MTSRSPLSPRALNETFIAYFVLVLIITRFFLTSYSQWDYIHLLSS